MAHSSSDAQSIIATVGYVRCLKIGYLDVWCHGKREGEWPCHHNSAMSIEGLLDEKTMVSIERRLR